MSDQDKYVLIVSVIAGLMLIGAVFVDWPYGYYQLLRWVVSIASISVAYTSWVSKHTPSVIIFGLFAILFNPIIPIHLTREIWQVIDGVTGLLFFAVGFYLGTTNLKQGSNV